MTWQNGRQLASINSTDLSASFSYGLDGIRTAKTVNGTTTEYYWQNGILQGQRTGNDSILFLYNASGAAYGMICKTGENESTYYYLFNAQGDVIALLDSAGNCVAEYAYDEWGKLLTITGSQADTTGLLNPIRYRGYYYDSETGFYYLQSRYYDPETGRFINADGILGGNNDLLSFNLFTYCGNNPVNMVDSTGYLAKWLTNVAISIVSGIKSSVSNFPVLGIPKDSNLHYSSDAYGEPNSKREWYDKNGNLNKERWYGPDSKAEKDRHHTDHGNSAKHPNVPHDHDWGFDKNGAWTPGPGYPSPKEVAPYGEIATSLVGVGATVVAGYGIYTGIKWAIAVFLAPTTGGASLAVAGVTP